MSDTYKENDTLVTTRSINIFSKDVGSRRYSSAVSFGDHKVALIVIYAPKIDKKINLFGELYPDYIDDLESSIVINVQRICNEYGVENVSLITRFRIKRLVEFWMYKASFQLVRKGRLTQKDSVLIYTNVFNGVCTLLKRRIQIEVSSVKMVTINKTFGDILDVVLDKADCLYTKEKLKTPLWWTGYIKESLNRLMNNYGRTAALGLFNLIRFGFDRDIKTEIMNKPVNWGCQYRLMTNDSKWTELQLEQISKLESSAGVVSWFLYKMFTELYKYQFSDGINNTVKTKTFLDKKFAGRLFYIFKACKGNKTKFYGCIEVINNISLLMLDTPVTKAECSQQKDSIDELFNEFFSYIQEHSNINRLKEYIILLSFTKQGLKCLTESGYFSEYAKNIEFLPDETSFFISEVNCLNMEMNSILNLFSSVSQKTSEFLWKLWDEKILDDNVSENSLRKNISDEILKMDSLTAKELYYMVDKVNEHSVYWMHIFKNRDIDKIENKEIMLKLILFLSLGSGS